MLARGHDVGDGAVMLLKRQNVDIKMAIMRHFTRRTGDMVIGYKCIGPVQQQQQRQLFPGAQRAAQLFEGLLYLASCSGLAW